MRLFIDSADIDQIKEVNQLGILAGVTTNPSLVAGVQKDFHQVIREICELVDGPISAEPLRVDLQGMLEEARILAALHPNVVVKIPMGEEGLKAISTLSREGIKTNATLVFSANQALLAARAGAGFVSPFLGRIDDVGFDGLYVLEEILEIFDRYVLDTEVIAASIRHPRHVTEAAKLGSHIATVPYQIIKAMIRHPLTDQGIERFVRDSENILRNR